MALTATPRCLPGVGSVTHAALPALTAEEASVQVRGGLRTRLS